VITRLSQILIKRGYAKPSHTQAAIEREATCPTGLPTDGIKTAIPHTGVEHSLKPGIAIATLARPVKFGELGDPDHKLDVSIVFMLCVTQPDAQVYLLQSLVEVYKDAELLRRLHAASDASLIVDELNASLAKVKSKAQG
jgi:PTS system galactitol-specific IIA component